MQFELIDFNEDDWLRLSHWEDTTRWFTVRSADGVSRRMKGLGREWHTHPEVELTIVTRGKSMRFVGGDAATSRPGEAVLIGSRVPHCWIEDGRYAGVCLQFPLELPTMIHCQPAADQVARLWRDAEQPRVFNKNDSARILRLTDAIAHARGLARASRMFELLEQLSASLSEATTLDGGAEAVSFRDADETVEQFIAWLLRHYSEEQSVADAARRCQMSRATFHRRFSRHTGRTFVEFVNQLRIAHALKELRATDRSVLDVAESVGFGSLSHFNKVFRLRYGKTPRDVRSERWRVEA